MLEGLATALRLATLRKGEDQVDIRGEVELAGPQLAHAQHHQTLLIAIAARGGAAPARRQERLQPGQRYLQAGLGQPRHRRRGGPHVGIHGPCQITPDDAHHARATEAPNDGMHGGFVLDLLEALLEPAAQGIGIRGGVEFATGVQVHEPVGIAHQRLGHEIRYGQHPGQLLAARLGEAEPVFQRGVAVGHFRQVFGLPQRLGEPLPGVLQRRPEGFGNVVQWQEVFGQRHRRLASRVANTPSIAKRGPRWHPPGRCISRRVSDPAAATRSGRPAAATP